MVTHHAPGIVHSSKLTATCSVRDTVHTSQKLTTTLALQQQTITDGHSSLTKQHWFHSLSFQQVQTLLTLFSKSFSPFPHGTCLLSVLNTYLALDENYHPVCAPGPRNVTLRMPAVHEKRRCQTGLSPFYALFSKRLASASPSTRHLQTTIQGH